MLPTLPLARVVAIHPESHSVDVEMMQTGQRIGNVRVLSMSAGGDFGMSDLTEPDTTGFGSDKSGTRDIYAAVVWLEGFPAVLGFMFPEVAQCLFPDKGRMVYRHGSDVYITIDAAGNTELAHPSGAFIRLGTSPAHEDLTGRDYDKKWVIKRNTGSAVHIHVEQSGGAASVDIAPAGAVKVKTKSTAEVEAFGKVSLKSDAMVDVTAPTVALNGNIVLNGPVTQGKGSNGGDCKMAGPLGVDGDVTAAGISLTNHVHLEQGDGNDVSKPK